MEFDLWFNQGKRFAKKDYHEGIIILNKAVSFIIYILLVSSIKDLIDGNT